MSLFYRCVLGVVLSLTIPAISANPVSAQCVDGTVTAEFQTTGPFAGLWKYTLSFSWNLPQGLSNVTLDCGFGECVNDACTATWGFETPAGTSTGVGGCTVEYAGEFNCAGNPSIGLNVPIVKWDALMIGGCEPANTGTGTLCFFTGAAPAPNSELPIILIKNGQNVCQGTVSGACPAVCTVPIKESTWGGIKADYHRDR